MSHQAVFVDASANHKICCVNQPTAANHGAKVNPHTFQLSVKGGVKHSPRFALLYLQAAVYNMAEAHSGQIFAALAEDWGEIHRQVKSRW